MPRAVLVICLPLAWALSTAPRGFGAPAKKLPAFQLSERTSDLALLKWMRGEGGDVGGVAVADFETGLRGLVATRDFKKGATVAGCPSALALALADPEATPGPEAEAGAAPTGAAPAPSPVADEASGMSAALSQLLPSDDGSDAPPAAARSPSSAPAAAREDDVGEAIVAAGEKLLEWYLDGPQGAAFGQYLATLPQREAQFSPTPDFWDDAALDALAFAPAIAARARARARRGARRGARGRRRRAALRDVARGVAELPAAHAGAGRRRRRRRAAASAQDRARPLPALDAINHAPEPNARMVVRDAEKDDATFAIVAEQKIAKGAQITLAYRDGAASSVDLLLDYGFVPNKPPAGADRRLLAKHRDELAALRAVPRKATLAELQEEGARPHPPRGPSKRAPRCSSPSTGPAGAHARIQPQKARTRPC